VLSNTEKMLKTFTTRLDKVKPKPTNKTPRKVLKISQTPELLEQEAIKELLNLYQTYNFANE